MPDSPPSWVDNIKEEYEPQRSLTFAWESFRSCNEANDVTVEYEYELLSKKSNLVVQSGIIAESEISLTNLEHSVEYNFRVRVFYSDAFEKNAVSLSEWSFATTWVSGKYLTLSGNMIMIYTF